jgi:hypothetical protein
MASEPDEHGKRYGIRGGLTSKQRTMLAAGKRVNFLVTTSSRNKDKRRAACANAPTSAMAESQVKAGSGSQPVPAR